MALPDGSSLERQRADCYSSTVRTSSTSAAERVDLHDDNARSDAHRLRKDAKEEVTALRNDKVSLRSDAHALRGGNERGVSSGTTCSRARYASAQRSERSEVFVRPRVRDRCFAGETIGLALGSLNKRRGIGDYDCRCKP